MSDDLMLDGMPEVPPAWTRPDQGVRLSAQDFDWMLQAALPHAGTDDTELPVLCSLHLAVVEGVLTVAATDRYTMSRERRFVSQTCGDFAFLLRTADATSLRVLLKTVLRGLKDEARAEEPVDLALERTDDGPTLRVLGQDLDVRFTELAGEYPTYDSLLDDILRTLAAHPPVPFDVALNPSMLARVVPAQRAGRTATAFTFTSASNDRGRAPVVVRTTNDDDDLVIAVMPIRTGEEMA